MTNIRFTKFTNKAGELGKVITLLDGELKKTTNVSFSSGIFETVDLDWSGFGSFISNLSNNQPISPSVCCKLAVSGSPLKTGKIIPKKKLANIKKSEAKTTLDRSKENFTYHTQKCPSSVKGNVFYLDIDDMEMFEREADLDFHNPPTGTDWGDHVENCIDAVISKILNDLPELKKLDLGLWAVPSAGALCFGATGNHHTGLTGLHVYGVLPTSSTISNLKDYIECTLWEKGHGYYKFSKNASALARTYIDLSTLTNNRLDFIGGAKLVGDLVQAYRTPIYYDTKNLFGSNAGGHIDLGNTITQSELDKLKLEYRNRIDFKDEHERVMGLAVDSLVNKEQISERSARNIIESYSHGIIKGSKSITFDSRKQPVKAWKILLNPDDYHNLTATDPTRPEKGPNKAQIYYNKHFMPGDKWELHNGSYHNAAHDARIDAGTVGGSELVGLRESSVVMHSFVAGGKLLRLEFDFESIMEVIEHMSEKELQIKLGSDWMQLLASPSLSESDRKSAINKIQFMRKNRGESASIKEIRDEFISSTKPVVTAELSQVLDKINKNYFLVFEKGMGMVYYQTREPWLDSTMNRYVSLRNDQLNLKLNKKDYEVFNHTPTGLKKVDVAKSWKEWEGRETYEGFVFKPNTDNRVIETKSNDETHRYLNLFQGFGANPKKPLDRECKGSACEGLGCFRWFFDTGYKTCNWKEVDSGDFRFKKFEFQGELIEVESDSKIIRIMKDNEYTSWGCGHNCGKGIQFWLRNTYENLANGDLRAAHWATSWVSDMFQNPGYRPGTALVCRGGQGTGKGMLMAPIGELARDYFVHALRMTDVTDKFNAALQNALMIFADESTYGGDIQMANVLKGIVTEDQILIEKKGVDKKRMENHVRLYIASNGDWVIPAETDDRRYNVMDTWSGHSQDKTFFGLVSGVKHELGSLMWELLDFELSDVRKTLVSEGLINQKAQSKDIVESVLTEILERLEPNSNSTRLDAFLVDDMQLGYEEMNLILNRIINKSAIRSRHVFNYINAAYPKLNNNQYRTPNSVGRTMKKSWLDFFTYHKQIRSIIADSSGNPTAGFLIRNVEDVVKLKNKFCI